MKTIVNAFIKSNMDIKSEKYVDTLLESCFLQSDSVDYNLIKIKLGNKEFDAKSIKLYNLLKIEQKQLWQSLFKIVPQGVLLKDVLNDTVSLVSSLVLLILEFQPLTQYQFSKEEAKFLFVLYKLSSENKELNSENINSKYTTIFGSNLSEENINNTFTLLDKMGVGQLQNSIFVLEEEIYIKR